MLNMRQGNVKGRNVDKEKYCLKEKVSIYQIASPAL